MVAAGVLGAGGRRTERLRARSIRIGALDLQRPRAHDLEPAGGADGGLQELDATPGAHHLRAHLELSERHRSQELVGDAADREPLTCRPAGRSASGLAVPGRARAVRLQVLERAHQQRRRGAAVLGGRVPRTASQLGRDESSISGEEYRRLRHGGTR